jgi:hypothetical protein
MKYFLLLFFIAFNSFSQNIAQHKAMYRKAFEEQLAMVQGKKPVDFKRSVFLVENAYFKNTLNYTDFCNQITSIGQILRKMIAQRGLQNYKTSGNWAAFAFLTDTIPQNNNKPYTYDFEDFYGKNDFSKQFVTKLLKTKNGNCHSLPFLYKLISNEAGASAFLALAPNHCYIKHIDEKGQWTNIEMTNGSFPRDQHIIKEMAVSVDAIRSGAYMRALTPKEEICFTMFDLASAYDHQFGYDNFSVEIASTALKYYPNSLELCMERHNALQSIIQKELNAPVIDTLLVRKQAKIFNANAEMFTKLGYKDMPKGQYLSWMKMMKEQEKKQKMNKQK